MSKTLWEMDEPSQSVDAANLYVRDAGGHFVEIGPLLSPSRGSGPPGGSSTEGLPSELLSIVYVGASADLSHVFMSYQPGGESLRSIFWPGDTTSANARSLYEYTGTGVVKPELVGVNNEGKLISSCGTELGSRRDKYNAVSANGERVFFTVHHENEVSEVCSPPAPAVNELYVRMDRSETVAISEPSFSECEICRTGAATPGEPAVTEGAAEFQGASEDGSKVFFTTEQELLEGQITKNLYEFDFDSPFGQRVVLVSKGSSEPEVQGVARVSEDGSHVYFVAKGVLTGANGEGNAPTLHAENLYVFERNATYPQGRTAFIATLSEEQDSQDWGDVDERPVQTTPEGRFLVFVSASQVFEYDAKEETLVNISMGHAAEINKLNTDAGFSSPTLAQSGSNISGDGSDVFFTSGEALTPAAKVAADAGAKSVYEYHSAGSISNGSVSLVSDGKDVTNEGIELYGVDASGDDVFFRTGDSLVGTDTNTERDLYDARVDGGFPEPVVPAGCVGEACHGARSSSPLFPLPGSSSAVGGGNLVPLAQSKRASTPNSLTRAQKFAKALEACGKDKSKKKRAACETQARKRYSSKSKAKKSGDGRVK